MFYQLVWKHAAWEGRTYFYNTNRRESLWKHPLDQATAYAGHMHGMLMNDFESLSHGSNWLFFFYVFLLCAHVQQVKPVVIDCFTKAGRSWPWQKFVEVDAKICQGICGDCQLLEAHCGPSSLRWDTSEGMIFSKNAHVGEHFYTLKRSGREMPG